MDEMWIDKDLPRVIPDDSYYSSEYGEGLKILRRLLEWISIYHEGSAYFNSIGFITAILLLYMDEEDTFWMINFLMESSIIKKWITQDRENIKTTLYIYQKLWALKLNEVYESLKANKVNPFFLFIHLVYDTILSQI